MNTRMVSVNKHYLVLILSILSNPVNPVHDLLYSVSLQWSFSRNM